MGSVIALRRKPLCAGSFRSNTRGTGSLFHGRSGLEERQSIRGAEVSYCPISAGNDCTAVIVRVE